MIPIPVIMIEISIRKITKPSSTPITEKIISVKIIIGLLIELNCITKMRMISKIEDQRLCLQKAHQSNLIFLLPTKLYTNALRRWKIFRS